MALIDVKTNIQNREIVDEPQTNDTYKIRQIIIKIMEYTHKQSQNNPTKTE